MESQTKKHILLVEDDVFMIDLLTNEFTHAGFEVTAAKTGQEGVAKFEEKKPDIIVLDILLPDQDGFETLRQIRQKSGGNEAKVIILSNISENSHVEEAKRLGVLDYLVKADLSLSEITARVKAVLGM